MNELVAMSSRNLIGMGIHPANIHTIDRNVPIRSVTFLELFAMCIDYEARVKTKS